MKIKLDNGAIMPTRAHEADAGLDLYARHKKTIPPHTARMFDTGVHIELPPNTTGFIKSKSGLNAKHSLLTEGVIDEGYTGPILIKVYNHGKKPYTVSKGDKISQLVIIPIVKPELELVEELADTERGSNGIGSTGK